jgi:decaprenylphospho-beta-D-erythro-pentofuranosid-2-ulose 2-reductase
VLGVRGRPGRVLVLGGTSELGLAIVRELGEPPGTEILLAGRDERALTAAGADLPYPVTVLPWDATAFATHAAMVEAAFAGGDIDLVIAAAGLLVPQAAVDTAPALAAEVIGANFTGHVTTLLEIAARLRRRRRGVIVVLSSVAAVRPRKANFVYGASKAGLDAFARGLADALHDSTVRVLVVRPGFVAGRMTAGAPPAPLATTPDAVGHAVAVALSGDRAAVWIPAPLKVLSAGLRLIPRPLWRRLRR